MCDNEVICRLCMSNKQLSSIFKSECDDEISLNIKAMECNLAQIKPGDGLPSYICEICKTKLHNFYQFKLQCLDTDFKLKKRYRNSNIDSHMKIKNEVEISTGSYLNVTYSDTNKFACTKTETNDESGLLDLKYKSNDSELIIEKNGLTNTNGMECLNSECSTLLTEHFETAYSNTFDINSGKNVGNEENLHNCKQGSVQKALKVKKKKDTVEKKENRFKVRHKSNFDQSFGNLSETCMKVDLNPQKILKKIKNVSKQIEKPLKPFQCELCGQVFRLKCILKKHMSTHTSAKLFVCPLCPKSYTRAEHRVVHMRLHTGIRPYICEACARSFIKLQDLERHRRIHSDERKYSCTRCDKKFKRSGDVHAHMRTHTGIRPFMCKFCSKTYTSHSGLRKHSYGSSQCKNQLSNTKDEKITNVLNINNSPLIRSENNS